MKTLQVEYDEAVGAAYLTFSDKKVQRTREIVADRVFLDVDSNDEPVGLEVLHLRSKKLSALLDEIRQVLDENEQNLGQVFAMA